MTNGKVVFIRHADFFKPVSGAYYGQSDLPLTPAGETQARNLAGLIQLQEPDIVHVYCSDLMRARRTAELALPNCEITFDKGLRELSFGDWEGLNYAEVKDEPEFEAFTKGSPAPGGEGEPEFIARVNGTLDAILANENGSNIAIVAHAGPIRAMLAHMLELKSEDSWRFQVDTASISTVTISDGYGYLSALNIRSVLFDK